ncbi:MAG TPA: hypothetical protein DIW16_13295 [Marinobacter hydrocarbonoclasticus]|jgi:hypothetical protein|uniref:hypothetical protein n=1 Tax=unclassified Marinobacter TaxID=83889 RepID=UPI000C91CB9A|nr:MULTISPECIES: hypothetical protein [unclassified Marinobacter]MAC21102.1 hypothetical protein [Marinobacter sp.]HCR47395.1 hypothetical protein [Marinobacter nauticus]|tara:strand:- start:38 stop:1072 length:1035 start_codon:yes stop_codon:yes gene_type:complete
MTETTSTLADQLLEAHVRHELNALKGAKLKKFLHQEVDELLEYANSVTLERVVSAEQIMGLIRRVVVSMELDAGIPELAADLATEVLKAPVQSQTRLGDILSREQASAFVEEALELRHQRERVISEIMAHPVYQELVSNVVYHGLVNYLYEDNLITRSVPGVGSMMKFGKKMANKAVPGLDETFERRIKAWLSDSLPSLIARSEQFLHKALSDDELRDTVMAAWVSLEDRTIEDLQDGLGDVQLQEFVVLGYDFWLHFRQTPYFEGCVQAVVEGLYARYGNQPVMNLLADIGVTREVIVTELEAVGLPLVDLLRQEGYLEALLRRRLEPFYRSAATKKLLAVAG